jgi:hypothetical protein
MIRSASFVVLCAAGLYALSLNLYTAAFAPAVVWSCLIGLGLGRALGASRFLKFFLIAEILALAATMGTWVVNLENDPDSTGVGVHAQVLAMMAVWHFGVVYGAHLLTRKRSDAAHGEQ